MVRSVVNRYTSDLISVDVLCAINAKKESAATKPPAITDAFQQPLRITDSTISVASLLDLVKEHLPDILPESVLRHYIQRAPEILAHPVFTNDS